MLRNQQQQYNAGTSTSTSPSPPVASIPTQSSIKSDAGSQTPSHHINTTIPDPSYHWNEWDLRRQAIQIANLTKMRTVSTQTSESHYRRENSTQYTLPTLQKDGTMEGVATQTGIEKSSQVERVYKYHAGLRGESTPAAAGTSGTNPDGTMRIVELRIPAHVEDTTNSSLQLKPHESLQTRIVRDPKTYQQQQVSIGTGTTRNQQN